MMGFTTPTRWRVADLHVGKIIHCPPHEEVNPRTRKGTGRLQKFIVMSIENGAAAFAPYRGDKPGEMPPEHVGE